MRTRTAIAAAAISALTLAACGSTTTVTDNNVAAPPSGSTTNGAGSGTSAAPPTSSSGTSSTPATGSGTSTGQTTTQTDTRKHTTSNTATTACVASSFRLAYIGGQGATGHSELGFSLTNIGASACHTYGYPGVQFQTSAGAPLPTNSTRTTQDFFGSAPIGALTVPVGGVVSFRIGTTDVGSTGSQCVTAAQLQVIPPDDTHTLTVPIPNGGAYECGSSTVTPLQQGTSAYR